MITAHLLDMDVRATAEDRIVCVCHGRSRLVEVLQRVGCRMTEFAPDFVVLGDTTSYHYEQIVTGAHLVGQGALLVATNPDVNCPTKS